MPVPTNPRTGHPTAAGARKILREGSVRGHALTRKQKGFFGLLAGGGTPSRLMSKTRDRLRR